VATVILYPAIDLKEGQCVRLVQGDMNQAKVFNSDATGQARLFAEAGFQALHIVDLDGAFAGKPMNAGAVEAILAAVNLPVQLGGGIRDMRTIEGWLAKGVARVIIGTAALRDPDLVREAARLHPGQIAVGIDARHGLVAIEGWARSSQVQAIDLALRFEDAGVGAIIHTDINRDGVLTGINVESSLRLAERISVPVIVSGGLASLDDIKRLLEPDCRRLAGVISGRALYDGRLDAQAALALIKSRADA
jgi:phosphoribosylformimino-5-aminoimidazole carboxamide ribotide isomerase